MGIDSRRSYRLYLRADLAAHSLTRWRFHYRLTHPELHYQRALRRVEYLRGVPGLWNTVRYPLARLYLARLSLRTGISIPPGVFGPGLSIAHYGSIVVNDQCRVGPWCRIHSATNLGVGSGGSPRIGARAYIGPGAVVYGGLVIGDDVGVGANSVVNADVASGTIVAGAPARVISQRGSSGLLPEWFPAGYALLDAPPPTESARGPGVG